MVIDFPHSRKSMHQTQMHWNRPGSELHLKWFGMLAKFSMKSLDILGGPQPVRLHRICSQQGSLVVEPQHGLLVEARRLLPNLTAHLPEAKV